MPFTGICRICGGSHQLSLCPSKPAGLFQRGSCYNCGKPNHLRAVCTNPMYRGEGFVRERERREKERKREHGKE